MNAVVLQAGVGRRLFHDNPGFAEEALTSGETAGRGALEELSRLLRVLEPDGGQDATQLAPRITDLQRIVEGIRATGSDVELRVEVDALPASGERAVVRIVQEALTNAVRHTTTGQIRVLVERDGHRVRPAAVRHAGARAGQPARERGWRVESCGPARSTAGPGSVPCCRSSRPRCHDPGGPGRRRPADPEQATREIVSWERRPRILILTTFDLDEVVDPALDAGADGFLPKRASPEQLTDGIRTVHAGDAAVAPEVTRRLLASHSARRSPDRKRLQRAAHLTDREADIVRALAEGLSNAEIAGRLWLSPETVETHL